MRQKTNGGPAEARNAGARVASGDVLVFLDADVAVHADTLEKIALRLGERPHLDAIFGAYDDCPAAPGTVSRFRNLLRHYFHLRSAGKAYTFWAGCGAIRRSAFEATAGFPESYTEASIEDVEFGRNLDRTLPASAPFRFSARRTARRWAMYAARPFSATIPRPVS